MNFSYRFCQNYDRYLNLKNEINIKQNPMHSNSVKSFVSRLKLKTFIYQNKLLLKSFCNEKMAENCDYIVIECITYKVLLICLKNIHISSKAFSFIKKTMIFTEQYFCNRTEQNRKNKDLFLNKNKQSK